MEVWIPYIYHAHIKVRFFSRQFRRDRVFPTLAFVMLWRCASRILHGMVSLLTNILLLLGLQPVVIDHDPPEVMSSTRNQLDTVPLVTFLEAFSEPAFILCSNPAPHESLNFIYGNPALRSLMFGDDDSGVLDKDSFFSALASDEDVFWLSNPVRSQSLPTTTSDFRPVGFRPAWLPRDHMPLGLEITPTPITLPVTIPGVASSNRSFVFTASPRKAAMDLLRSNSHSDLDKRRDPGLRLHDLPQPNMAVGQRFRSRKSKSSSSWPSQRPLVARPVEMPSSLIETYPWETTALGPKVFWPTSLNTILRYMMEKPIPVSLTSFNMSPHP